MSLVAIVVPVLNRPQHVKRLMDNVAATTTDYRLLFVANEGDDEEIAELVRCKADHMIVPGPRVSWACKVNDGFRETTEPWVFTGADDLLFHAGWFERALAWADNASVVGTNDIANPRVMTGQHSTHTLFARSYVEQFGTIDEPGKIMHEGYRHDYADDEAIATAKARGVYAHAFDAIVEHLHPMVGKSPDDDTYRKGRKWSTDGRRVFMRRKALWADEEAVRIGMVPAPDRAVVVTATYGGYDPELRSPVEQDMPVEWVCFTDNVDLEVPPPWRVVLAEPVFPDNPRLSAKVPKMTPDVGCDHVVWMDASHEIVSPSFVREALAARHDGVAAFRHPRRDCPFQEIAALLGPENQNGLYFYRPLQEQADAYHAEGHPERAGLYACGVVAWDLSNDKARDFGAAWLRETEKWSHQDQVEFPVVARRLGLEPGFFSIPQLDPKVGRGQRYLGNRWLHIHPHSIKAPALPVSVLIPFSSEDPDRIANLAYVTKAYEARGWEVIVGTCEGAWSKGRALADAFPKATHDLLVIADADCLLDDPSLDHAVQLVLDGTPWVVPHKKTWRLDRATTLRIRAGAPLRTAGPSHGVIIGGGIIVCTREAWETSGGVDPRFYGWGGEDISVGWALETLVAPPVLGTGKLMHLFHPLQEPRKGSPDSEALAGRYRRARGDVEAMRALVDEAKVCV